ncbi:MULTISPECIES: LysE family translocator [Pseudomonas]|uniref:Lysine transporter LysE n=1 Tax=Pseudomonas marincola TaxID=437900 RepID=A0A653E618_9PSED|nr:MULTISPECIES: LysE family translocator [Pseudomonas]OEO23854.1 lysine transporter LysE [Pseudomonas sp. J237]CAE6902609.1 Transporter, LysE family [Pseudomonas marincola]HCP57186.1 LysE family translocator [Pseudomonas sp.]
MSIWVSMAAFALASSITPGPVNIVALSAGVQFGLRASLRHVTGATVGFCLLLVLIGLGLHEVLRAWPPLTRFIQLGGVAFLLFMAYKLAVDDGQIRRDEKASAPSMLYGATLQWLNPKAWMACVAGMGLFVEEGNLRQVAEFSLIYFAVCYVSIACWAVAGSYLRGVLETPAAMRLFNRLMAALLVACCVYLLLS